MTEDEFMALKVGDRIERIPQVIDKRNFRAEVYTASPAGFHTLRITEVLSHGYGDVQVGNIWPTDARYAERYVLLSQAPIPFPVSPEPKEVESFSWEAHKEFFR